MTWRAIVTASVILGVGSAGDDGAKKELKKLQGTWKVTRMEVAGVKMPQTAYEHVTVVIDGDKLAFRDKGKTYEEIECVLDPSKKPREIDLHYVTGLKKGVVEIGIYEIDGDVLKICQSLQTGKKQKRPSEPDSPKGAPQQLMVLKRAGG
jgi:uncharacterized protein (TIGR03067 family)